MNEYERLVAQETLILDVTEEVDHRLDQDSETNRKWLAGKLGCGKSHVTQLLSGERNLTLRTVADLASAFDCKATITFEPLNEGIGQTPSSRQEAGR